MSEDPLEIAGAREFFAWFDGQAKGIKNGLHECIRVGSSNTVIYPSSSVVSPEHKRRLLTRARNLVGDAHLWFGRWVSPELLTSRPPRRDRLENRDQVEDEFNRVGDFLRLVIAGQDNQVEVGASEVDEDAPKNDDNSEKGVAPRNCKFLEWYEADGEDTHHSPTKICDKWNGMKREERAKICEASVGNVTRDVVEKGIQRARKSRDKK